MQTLRNFPWKGYHVTYSYTYISRVHTQTLTPSDTQNQNLYLLRCYNVHFANILQQTYLHTHAYKQTRKDRREIKYTCEYNLKFIGLNNIHYCFMHHHTIDPGGTKTEFGINKIVW